MKNIYITITILLIFTTSYGQNKSTEKADKLFNSYQYVRAIAEYLKLADSNKANQYVFNQLGDCYYIVFNSVEASKWYRKAVETKAKPETYYRYAQSLKGIKNYKEANNQMDVFASMLPNDSRAIEHKLNPNYVPSLVEKEKLFDVTLTNINSKGQSDFGAILSNDNILYFVSTRNNSRKTDKWNNQPYLDVFKSIRNSNGTLSEPTQISELNTPYHDGPLAISNDGNTLFFARDGLSSKIYKKNNNVKVGQQGLYKATKVDGKWSNIKPLPFNSTDYSITSPSLSKDGKTLYFASNMPGGFGESDIWKVTINSNEYSKPENLGTRINTSEKENFPFISEDNELYFSSTGKLGFGGYDIFKIDLNANNPAENVGKPVNSEKDDFSFSINKTADVGFFSSNRNGTDAIFSAKPICATQAIVIVTNKKTGTVLPNATVSIADKKGNIIATKTTDINGKVSYDISCKTSYNVLVSAANFDSASSSIEVLKAEGKNLTIPLEPASVIITDTEVILNPIYFDFNKSNITSQGASELDKLVKVMQDNPKLIIFVRSHTDSKGSPEYNLSLSEKRVQATVQYIISKDISSERISGKGIGSSEQKIKCGLNCTEDEDSQNRRSEFLIVKK
ncbi:OmpA family protein [Flavobacterium sp.]|uniref:OmpA family protein n=1 Tax=Flavobacterium sp. TaxID=239 RepID=UPI003BD36CFB